MRRAALVLVVLTTGAVALTLAQRPAWTAEEVEHLRALWIGGLPALDQDPSNDWASDPRAAALGQRIFFDPRFSASGQVSCASCHLPERAFTDGLALARGAGTTDRTTMPIVGTQYARWLFWDGRKDSQWAQALGPLESDVEHAGDRGQYAHVVADRYRSEYEAIFGPLPPLHDRTRFPDRAGPVADLAARAAWEAMSPADQEAVTRVFVNLGKAIAAYERLLLPGETRFDRYVEDVLASRPSAELTRDEVAGLRLFIGRAQCIDCHRGPLLTNDSFHNTGIPEGAPGRDLGRAMGASRVIDDEFNCLSRWSDAQPAECEHLTFIKATGDELTGQFRAPSLRGVAERGPYMHAGQLESLADVVEHYDRAPTSPVGRSEIGPLGLSAEERDQLEAFLRSLSAPPDASPSLLRPPG